MSKETRSIKNVIFMHFGVFTSFIFIVILSISYFYFYHTLIQRAQNNKLQTVKEVMHNLDFYFDEMESTLKTTALNEEVVNGLANVNTKNYYDSLQHSRTVRNLIMAIKIINKDINDVIIIKDDGYTYEATMDVKYDYNFLAQPWFPIIDQFRNKKYFIEPHDIDYFIKEESNMRSISAVMPIWSVFSRNHIGLVMAEINENTISDILSRLKYSSEDKIYLVNKNNEIICAYGKNAEDYFNDNLLLALDKSNSYDVQKINGVKQLILYQDSSVAPWQIIVVTPIKYLVEDLKLYQYLVLVGFLIMLPIIFVATYALSKKIVKPIDSLMGHMDVISTGEFIHIEQSSDYVELNTFTLEFNIMIDKINKLINDVYKMEIASKESQLRALQQRIDPHFLFNSLQLIQSMAVLNQTEEIKQMAKSLGFLFRYAIVNSENLASIEEEVQHLKHYMEVQTKWFYKSCSYELKIDDSILDCKIPRLSLQPIVENIFRHGFRNKEEGQIVITGYQMDSYVIIQVRDNGVGISDERLLEIKGDLEQLKESKEGKHIGLRNVHKRLVLKFGEQYGISLKSKKDSWTEITLKIPV